jgi:hypothetical protein
MTKSDPPREYLVRTPDGHDYARDANLADCKRAADRLGPGARVVGLNADLIRYRPVDWTVHVVPPTAAEKDAGAPVPLLTTCGQCGRTWDDAVGTEWTPAPSGRCPFEYSHVPDQTGGQRTRITVPLRFDVDLAAWAADYGITEAEAHTDLVGQIRSAAGDGSLAQLVTNRWPMMRDGAVVSTGEPIVEDDQAEDELPKDYQR